MTLHENCKSIILLICRLLAGFAKFTSSVMNGLTPFGKELANMQKTISRAVRANAARTDKGKDNVICFDGGDRV